MKPREESPMSNVLLYIIIVLSVVLSAFFSGSENAIANFNKIRAKKAAENGNKKAKLSLRLSEDFSKTISAILFGNNMVNIISSTAATVLCLRYFPIMGETVATIAITVIVLIFGEIIPKIIAVEYADKVAPRVSVPLNIFIKVSTPVVSGVSFLIGKLSVLWTPKEPSPQVTADELVTMVEEIEEEGVFSEKESELIKSAIEFTDRNARDIMTHRVDMVAFDIDDGIDKFISDHELLQYSLVPVYRDTLDNIIGILSTHQVVRAIVSGEEVNLEQMIKEPYFVHMTKTISSILGDMRKNHSQIAIVIDEYGGTLGLLTREDITEEIVGEIYDETDEPEEPEVRKIDEDCYLIDGGMSIEDMFDEIGYSPENFESEYETVGGFASEQLDKIPSEGDHFVFDRIDVTVVEAKSMRVETVMVKLLENPKFFKIV